MRKGNTINRKRGKARRRERRRGIKQIINAMVNINPGIMNKSRGSNRIEILAERDNRAETVEECKEMTTWTISTLMESRNNNTSKKIRMPINRNHMAPTNNLETGRNRSSKMRGQGWTKISQEP